MGDTPITSSGWIEDEKFGFYGALFSSSSVEFDSAVTRTGRLTLKVSTVDTSGRARFHFGVDPGSTPNYPIDTIAKYGIPIKPSTRYRVNCYVKTVNANTNSVFLFAQQATLVGVKTGSNKYSNRLTGNNDFTLLTLNFTSEADAAYLALSGSANVAGNISDAWFDVNSMTLEEVVTDTTFTGKVAEKIRPVLQA
ncbi:MAG: hypothetical protein GX309_06780, partial [Clostridiales bacterium]|nr:hypothetical protein [Clostridiales bacterium]